MRKYEYNFGEFLLFVSPVIISLFFYSLREGYLCSQFIIKPMLEEIYNEITYTSDAELYGVFDLWQYPEVTLENGSGDCEDVSILLATMITQKTLLPAYIVTGDGRELTHAWVYFKQRYYDPTRNKIVRPAEYYSEFTNIDYLSLNEALRRCKEDEILSY